MEPERPIEKLLRGYAKQRREQAGEPPPMHPAMRRQLLSEAARTYGRRQRKGSWWLMLKGFWPRLALGAAGMAVLIVGAAIWTSSGTRNSEFQLAKNEGLRSTSSALSLDNKTLSDAPRSDEFVGRMVTNNTQVAEYSVTDAVASPPAASPAARFEMKQDARAGATPITVKDESATTLAANAPSRELQDLARDKERSYGETAAASRAAQPESNLDASKFGVALQANTLAEAPGEVAKLEAAPPQQQSISFKNTSVTQLFRNQMPIDGQKAPAPVMAQFRVEQEGPVVRIIDNDGSVYTGSLQEADMLTAAKPAPTLAMDTAQRKRALEAPQSRPDQIQNFHLEATGTNRTLNQKVVFTGNLVGNQISLSSATQYQQALQQNQKLQQQLSNVLRISGKAKVGAGTDQVVEAVPLQ